MSSSSATTPVIVSGVRTPFMRSYQAYMDLSSCDLAREALAGLLSRTGLPKELIEYVCMGTVIHDPRTPNIARESALNAGLSAQTPAHTVSLACISSNIAATSIADKIRVGKLSIAVASGVDTCSDPPIRLSRELRKTLLKLQKVKKPLDMLKHFHLLSGLKARDFLPDIPSVAEFSNGKSMGEGAEILAQRAGVTREEADLYAARSHALAVQAQKDKIFEGDILNLSFAPKFKNISADDGPREDSTFDRLSKLKPAFDKSFGICTAANSSFLTDGASALLMMSQARAKELGYKAMAILRDDVYESADPLIDMLSGPAITIPTLLRRNKLRAEDIGVWEIHEAFASQVLANLKFLKDKKFAQERFKSDEVVGEIHLDKINVWGGSLSLGHPFGATGARLLWTAAKRLQREGARFAVVSGCAAGGHGSAILLENPDFA
ncbi:MAG: acetyl-CoA C-acyltransferase [Oligoflexales bacterium]|nr:acetyl-CoA C-acyltransferase [Oligoflexales bacterium]